MSGRPTITPSSSVTMVSLCRRIVVLAGAVALIPGAFLLLAALLGWNGPVLGSGARRSPAQPGPRRRRGGSSSTRHSSDGSFRPCGSTSSPLVSPPLHGAERVAPAGPPAIAGAAAP